MKKIVLVYTSHTGFTKQYAHWIQEELNCHTLEMKEASLAALKPYDIIIYGGGMHANRVNGMNRFLKQYPEFKHKDVIIFATGATPMDAYEEIKQFERLNIPQDSNIPFFYFHSGMNYADMKGVDKLMMNSFRWVLNRKKQKNAVEEGTLNAIQSSYDHSNKAYIDPLVRYVLAL